MASKSVRRRKRSSVAGSNTFRSSGKTKYTGESYDTVTARVVGRKGTLKKKLVQTRSNRSGQVRGIF